jgi:hypothetical protein
MINNTSSAIKSRLIAEFELVGGSAVAFVKRHHIAYGSFRYLLRVHR